MRSFGAMKVTWNNANDQRRGLRDGCERAVAADAYPSVDASRALVDADSLDLPAALN
jgi:hypothetical protein